MDASAPPCSISLLDAPFANTVAHMTQPPTVWAGTSSQATLCIGSSPNDHQPPRAARPRPRDGALIGSRYRLIRPLGTGGVGEVWMAEDLESSRRVAIKLMLPGGRQTLRLARFLREGRLISTLRHPHIVEVLEVGGGDEGQQPFLAMELLTGPSLGELVEHGGPLPWSRVRPLLLQICEALAHAHERAIVHHDVKPSNIVLASEPGEPDRSKLVDFGIARRNLLDEDEVELTCEGQMLGSPGYMSPEQIRGQRANPESDLFGLGCTAYYLLTGRDPFEAHTLPALIHSTMFGPAPALGEIGVGPAKQRAIEAVIHRALEKDPADRHGSARETAAAIEAIDAA